MKPDLKEIRSITNKISYIFPRHADLLEFVSYCENLERVLGSANDFISVFKTSVCEEDYDEEFLALEKSVNEVMDLA